MVNLNIKNGINLGLALMGFLFGAPFGAWFGTLWGSKGISGVIGFILVTLTGMIVGLVVGSLIGADRLTIVSGRTLSAYPNKPGGVGLLAGIVLGALAAWKLGYPRRVVAKPPSDPAE
jgi:hypothetical protein